MAVAQKEYMMLLTIAGAIGPNFNATFQKAEKN